ncbi:hypothetical protein AAC387_Pa07g1645 [Persea americana]
MWKHIQDYTVVDDERKKWCVTDQENRGGEKEAPNNNKALQNFSILIACPGKLSVRERVSRPILLNPFGREVIAMQLMQRWLVAVLEPLIRKVKFLDMLKDMIPL